MWFRAFVVTAYVAFILGIAWMELREAKRADERAAEALLKECVMDKLVSDEEMTEEIAGQQCALAAE